MTTPQEFASGDVQTRLCAVREAIGRVLLSQETDVNGNRNKRAMLADLQKYEQQLMEELDRENGSSGFFITDYSRGPTGGIR
jgi:hypothetical protein